MTRVKNFNFKQFKTKVLACIISIFCVHNLSYAQCDNFSFLNGWKNIFCSANCHSLPPIYFGFQTGNGATSWNCLVPKDPSDALATSIPTGVSSSRAVWGLYTGYYFSPQFALELSYMHYPTTRLEFNELSLFSFNHDGLTTLRTRTSRIALMGKFLLHIPCTCFDAYSSIGAADIRRRDAVVKRNRISPAFGAGIDYHLTRHLIAELASEYVAGYGQSELDPAQHYIPFLYSVTLRLSYLL